MSIANEIQRLQGAKADIKAAIERKGVIVGDGTIDTYVEKIGEISGGGSVVNSLEYATQMYQAYYNATFPNGYELSLNVPNITSLQGAFQSASGIEKVVIKGNNDGNVINISSAFRNCRSIKIIDLTEFNAKIGSAYMFSYYASELQEVLGELNFSETTTFSSAFSSCINLVTITPKSNTIKFSISLAQSSKLSDTSIQSIIDGLADLTTYYYMVGDQVGTATFEYPTEEMLFGTGNENLSVETTDYTMTDGVPVYKIYDNDNSAYYVYKKGGGTAQTLTLHSTVGGKLTDEQKATITAKNWELVY